MRTGTKVVLAAVAGVIFVAFCIRTALVWHWDAKVKAEIKLFEAEGGATRLADLAPATVLPDGTKRRFYRQNEFYYTFPEDWFPPDPKASAEENARGLQIATAARDFENWSGISPDGVSNNFHKLVEWTDDWLAPLEGHLARNKPLLDAVKAAVADGTGTIEVDWQKGFDAKIAFLSDFNDLCRLLRIEAIVRARKGDIASALDDARVIMRMRRLIDDIPLFQVKGRAMGADKIGASAINGIFGFGSPDRASVARILAELADHEERNRADRIMAGETTLAIECFRVMRRDPSAILRYRNLFGGAYEPNPGEVALGQLAKLVWIAPADECKFLAEARAMRAFLKQPLPRGAPPRTPLRARSLAAWATPLSSLFVPIIYELPGVEEESDAYVRMIRTALALSLYRADTGAYPASLTALVPNYLPAVPFDPCDGRPLRYKPAGTGYTLYSIGRNGLDEGGTPFRDIVWKRRD